MESEDRRFLFRGLLRRVSDSAWGTLGVRILLVEEGTSMSSCLCTTILDTLDFGGGRGPCDRGDDRRGALCLTTLLSIMSKSSITCVFKKLKYASTHQCFCR